MSIAPSLRPCHSLSQFSRLRIGGAHFVSVEERRRSAAEVQRVQHLAVAALGVNAAQEALSGIATIAKEEGVSVFHRFEIMHRWLLGRQLSFATMLSPDQLHLNDASYGCIGRLLAAAIV